MSAEVFISYAAKDRDRVLNLVKRLRGAGVSVWIDQAGIDVATMWSREIVGAIRECKLMLLSISPNSTESENVVKEVALASERKKTIIPVYLESAEIPETMEYQLAGIQRMEYFKEREEVAFQAMIRALVKFGVSVNPEAIEQGEEGFDANLAAHSYSRPVKKKHPLGVVVGSLVAIALVGLLAVLLFSGSDTPPSNDRFETATSNSDDNSKSAESGKTSIAILPFRNIGPTKENSFLAEGMHEEIEAMLSIAPSLMVKEASRFKELTNDPKMIGEALQVDAVVTGSVRQAAGQMRVIVKLVDTKTEAHLWAKTFNEPEGDVFVVQQEIAQSIAEGLQLKLDAALESRMAGRQTRNLEAYNLYLEGRNLWKTRSREGMRNAIEKFDLALAKDNGFALAHVGIADAYNQLVRYDFSPSQVSYPKAQQELEKALELNDNLAEVHASLGYIQYDFEWDWQAAEVSLKKAVSLNPSYPEARRWLSHVYLLRGKIQLAFEEIEVGMRLEQNSANMLQTKAFYQIVAGQFDEAIVTADQAISVNPKFHRAYFRKGTALLRKGELESALQEFKKGEEHRPGVYKAAIAGVLGAMGQTKEAREILDQQILRKESQIVSSTHLAEAFYQLGDHDKALQYFEIAINEKDPSIPYFYAGCNWVPLFDDSRFRALCKRLNQPPKLRP